MDCARACNRSHLCLCVAPQSRDRDYGLSLFRHTLGSRVDVDSARGQLLPAWSLSVSKRRGKPDRSIWWIGVCAIYSDDVCGEIIFTNKGYIGEIFVT